MAASRGRDQPGSLQEGEAERLEKQMGEVLGEEIKSMSEGVDNETRSKESRLEELEVEQRDHEEDMKKVEASSQNRRRRLARLANG